MEQVIRKYIKFFFLFIFLFASSVQTQTNIYQYIQAGMLSPAVKNALYRVYVPNGLSGTVSIIDPTTYKVIDTFHTGKDPQHVVPAYDLQTLYVLNNLSNTTTLIDPVTAKPIKTIPLDDPYNLYFTPDGKYAIVVCEARKELEFCDPKTMKIIAKLHTECGGVNHMDFTVDGKYALTTCEYSGQLMKVDIINKKVIAYLSLSDKNPVKKSAAAMMPMHKAISNDLIITADGNIVINDGQHLIKEDPMPKMNSMPQDIRSSPDGKIFYVADMMKDGVFLIDPVKFTKIDFIPTGVGTHAIYPSRDGKLFYISNRGCHHMNGCSAHGPGDISVFDPAKRKVIAIWAIPQGGSPDMGNVTPDGKELWLSGRFDNEVYVFNTVLGKLTHRIPVGKGPHGLAVWPQPGRYSLGHTGNMR